MEAAKDAGTNQKLMQFSSARLQSGAFRDDSQMVSTADGVSSTFLTERSKTSVKNRPLYARGRGRGCGVE